MDDEQLHRTSRTDGARHDESEEDSDPSPTAGQRVALLIMAATPFLMAWGMYVLLKTRSG